MYIYIYIYSVLNGGKYFGKNGAQNYKGMSEERIENPPTSVNSFASKKVGDYQCSKFVRFLQTRYIVKRFKHRFDIRSLIFLEL